MADGIILNDSIIGVEPEVTEGTYVAPSAATSYVQPISFSLTPSKELIERAILSNGLAKATPRVGQRSVTAELEVEFRGSGTEGGQPDFHEFLLSTLGTSKQETTQTTTKASGNTATNLEIEDADISKFAVGDMVVVLESGDHGHEVVTAVDTTGGAANITVSPGRTSGSYSNSVVISKFQTYSGSDTGHSVLSLSYYWANEILQKAIGTRVSTMSLNNWSTGQVASWGFAMEGLNFDEVDGAAAHTPSYDSGLPPLILSANLFQDGTALCVNEVGLEVSNDIGFLTTTKSTNGRTAGRYTKRNVSGAFNPYKDDTSVANFTKFDANTEFSLFLSAYNPSSVSGEIELGSAVGIYLPKCITTEQAVGDIDGVLTDDISFMATGGSDGSATEVYVGLV